MDIELGKIIGVWGVKGWVKLHSYTRYRADISKYKTWWLKTPTGDIEAATEYKVLNCREQGKGVVAQLHGVTAPEQAMALNGKSIWVAESELPELPSGQYYWQQLIGLSVSNEESIVLGTVDSILETGANDVLILKSPSGDEVLIPYVDQVVREVDVVRGTLLVDWSQSYLE